MFHSLESSWIFYSYAYVIQLFILVQEIKLLALISTLKQVKLLFKGFQQISQLYKQIGEIVLFKLQKTIKGNNVMKFYFNKIMLYEDGGQHYRVLDRNFKQ